MVPERTWNENTGLRATNPKIEIREECTVLIFGVIDDSKFGTVRKQPFLGGTRPASCVCKGAMQSINRLIH